MQLYPLALCGGSDHQGESRLAQGFCNHCDYMGIDYIAIAFRWLTIVGRGLPTVSSKDLQSVSKRRIAVDCSGTANPLSFAHSVWRDPTDFNDLQ